MQQQLHEKDQRWMWMGDEEKEKLTAADGSQGKAIIVALSHDNPKAVTQAFGFDGASLDARVRNTKQLQDDLIAPGVTVEVDSYGDFPLFIKTTDGESTAMDGARGSFGELTAGAFDEVLLRYEVGDTALDVLRTPAGLQTPGGSVAGLLVCTF